MPVTGSVYVTSPIGPTRHEIVSDGSPLPPPISSTFWPIPIRASSTRPAVNGANICAMSTRYLSQYRAEACHASRALFCSLGFILVRRTLTPFFSLAVFLLRLNLKYTDVSLFCLDKIIEVGRALSGEGR